MVIFLLYSWGTYAALHHRTSSVDAQGVHGFSGREQDLLTRCDKVYLLGLGAVEVYCAALHAWVAPCLEFLPLMLISVFCALGVTKEWLCLGMHLTRAPVPFRKDE